MIMHELKIRPYFFEEILAGSKAFEIRKNDRDYKINDLVLLREFDKQQFTKRMLLVKITSLYNDALILNNERPINKDWCIWGFKVLKNL